MFNEIIGILGGFQNFILCLVIGLVAIAVITLLGFSLFRLENPVLGWYALFLNAKRRTTWIVSLGLLRTFYITSLIWLTKSFQLTHVLVYVLIAVCIWGIVLRFEFVLYDAVYSVGVLGIAYLLHLIHKELGKVQVPDGMGVLFVAFAALILIAGIGQLFFTVNAVAPKSDVKTEVDRKIKLASYIILPVLFLVLIVPYFMLTHITSISLKSGGIQFVNGEARSIEAGSKITQTEEGCMVSVGDSSYLLLGTPVYDKSDGSVIFTEYCSIIRPKLQMTNRISPMSKLVTSTNGFQIKSGNRNSSVENFFLFDGLDTYYFPETTTLQWDEETIELSSFSKVDVLYNQRIEIFDYETESYTVYDGINGMCIATMKGNEKINLSTDILYRENGEEQMLFLQPMLLPDLE